jgi:uncharacterized protein
MSSETPPRGFCWIELATTELARAQRYYDRILDWQPRSMGLATPSGAPIHYQCFWRGERVVGGFYEHVGGARASAAGAHWKGYVAVADAERALRRAEELGARVLVPPLDLLDFGRFALLADPQHAPFGLWQTRSGRDPSSARDDLGLLRWMEHSSPDPGAAARFYEQLFGWRTREVALPAGPYHLLEHDGVQIGGLAGPAQPHARGAAAWLPYFQVEDSAALSERAANLLGELVTPPERIDGVATYAVLRDPQRALFGLLTPAAPGQSCPPARAPAGLPAGPA